MRASPVANSPRKVRFITMETPGFHHGGDALGGFSHARALSSAHAPASWRATHMHSRTATASPRTVPARMLMCGGLCCAHLCGGRHAARGKAFTLHAHHARTPPPSHSYAPLKPIVQRNSIALTISPPLLQAVESDQGRHDQKLKNFESFVFVRWNLLVRSLIRLTPVTPIPPTPPMCALIPALTSSPCLIRTMIDAHQAQEAQVVRRKQPPGRASDARAPPW